MPEEAYYIADRDILEILKKARVSKMKTRKTLLLVFAFVLAFSLMAGAAYADWFKVLPGDTVYRPIGDPVEPWAEITGTYDLPGGIYAVIENGQVLLKGTIPENPECRTFYTSVSCSDGSTASCEILVDNPFVPPVRQPPYITFQSRFCECYVGDREYISVEVENPGGYDLYYSWAKNGVTITGADASSYCVDTYSPGTDSYVCTIYYYVNGNQDSITSNAIPVQVTQKQISVTGIGIASTPATLNYTVGDYLNTNGLAIYVFYSDGSTKTEWSGFSYSPNYLNRVGTQQITVNYNGFTTYFNVNVKDRVKLNGISLNRMPNKTIYKVGEQFDPTGMQINLNYSDGSQKILAQGFSYSPVSFTKDGTKTITVSYEGKTCTFNVQVYKATAPTPTANPGQSPKPVMPTPTVSPMPGPEEDKPQSTKNHNGWLIAIIAVLDVAIVALVLCLVHAKKKNPKALSGSPKEVITRERKWVKEKKEEKNTK